MCKHGNMFSLAVLIGRGLDHTLLGQSDLLLASCFQLYSVLSVHKEVCKLSQPYAPLAQLVEHLTLNQGVPGSSP